MNGTVKMVEIGSIQNDHFQAMSTPGFERGSGMASSSVKSKSSHINFMRLNLNSRPLQGPKIRGGVRSTLVGVICLLVEVVLTVCAKT